MTYSHHTCRSQDGGVKPPLLLIGISWVFLSHVASGCALRTPSCCPFEVNQTATAAEAAQTGTATDSLQLDTDRVTAEEDPSVCDGVIEMQLCPEDIAQAQPSDALKAFYLGRTAFFARQYEEATMWFGKAVELEEGNSDYHLWLGRAYGQRAMHTAAGEQFFLARKVRVQLERAVALDPATVSPRDLT